MVNGLEITEISIKLMHGTGKTAPLLAFVSLVLNDSLRINGMRVIRLNGKTFVCYPREISRTGVPRNIVSSVDVAFGEMMSDEILDLYNETVAKETKSAEQTEG